MQGVKIVKECGDTEAFKPCRWHIQVAVISAFGFASSAYTDYLNDKFINELFLCLLGCSAMIDGEVKQRATGEICKRDCLDRSKQNHWNYI